MWSAYVDESGSNNAKDPGTYIVAAMIIEESNGVIVGESMRSLRLSGQRKVHWRDEGPKRQRQIAETIAVLPVEHLIVIRVGGDLDRPERRRRKCLQELFLRLQEIGVAAATFESRGPKDDQRDLEVLQSFRASKMITGSLRIHHQVGPAEPLLWVPDAVCGAVVAGRTGDPDYLDLIQTRCPFYNIS